MAYNAGMPPGASLREQAAPADGGRAQGLYFEDVWSWSREQADALRQRRLEAVDWDNVIEEIDDVGNRHSDAWTSHCTNVISHLLKIEHSGSDRDLNRWRKEVEAWRVQMHRKLRKNRGMTGKLAELLQEAWEDGRADAVTALPRRGGEDYAAESRLRRSWEMRLPPDCPYALVDIAGYDPRDKDAEPSRDVWPAQVARVLNEGLGTDYPARIRVPERGGGRTR